MFASSEYPRAGSLFIIPLIINPHWCYTEIPQARLHEGYGNHLACGMYENFWLLCWFIC